MLSIAGRDLNPDDDDSTDAPAFAGIVVDAYFPAVALSAKRHAVSASGRTCAAIAGAFALAAVPSRTRPTMPLQDRRHAEEIIGEVEIEMRRHRQVPSAPRRP